MSNLINNIREKLHGWLATSPKVKKVNDDLVYQIDCYRILYWVRANLDIANPSGALNIVLTTGKDSAYYEETKAWLESKPKLFEQNQLLPLYLHFPKNELPSILSDLAIASKLFPMDNSKECCEYIIKTIASAFRCMADKDLPLTAVEVYFDGKRCRVYRIDKTQSKERPATKPRIENIRIRDWVTANHNAASSPTLALEYLTTVLATDRGSKFSGEASSWLEEKTKASKDGELCISSPTPLYFTFPKEKISNIMKDLDEASQLLPNNIQPIMKKIYGYEDYCDYIMKAVAAAYDALKEQGVEFTSLEVYFDGTMCSIESMNTLQAKNSSSVLQPWTSKLTWKQQTVLMCALRGCDMSEKNDLSKHFIRFLRNSFLNNAGTSESDFMKSKIDKGMIYDFSKEFDKYPIHFLLHLIHAYEIIGYEHPDEEIASTALHFYTTMVQAFHMNLESEQEMRIRLKDGVDTCCHKT